MFMGRTFTVPHRALRDTTLQGYFVPKVRLALPIQIDYAYKNPKSVGTIAMKSIRFMYK